MTGSNGGTTEHETERALALLQRFGWNATSFQSLEPGFRYWFAPDGDAVVAFVDTGAAWVAAGAPIAAPARIAEVADRFVRAARAEGRRVGFFAVEDRFLAATEFDAIPIGEQPVWDPSEWDRTLGSSRSLREQVRRATAKGVSIRRVDSADLERPDHPDRLAIEGLIARWLARRRLAPMGFLVQIDLFTFAPERRLYLAERGGRPVGFLGLVPVYARRGWLLEDLLRDADSPNGTAELLVDAAMRGAAAEGSRYATLGLAPLAGRVSRWFKAARVMGRGLYNFEGLRAFKSRLRPEHWVPIYASHPPGQTGVATVYDALAAFAPDGFVRFGLRSLLRRPGPLIRLLTMLLVPWTLLLLLAAPDAWFPSRAVRLAWTGFDVILIAALLALTRRWRPGLARTLAAVITADAIVTLIEVAGFNATRPMTTAEALAAVIAVVGPSIAAALLWATITGVNRPAGATIQPPRA